ncbi:MOSC domain-containing protein [Amycolatopsis sp.]|uniref:MOSC domain-containing protein n=1 Tax=Amycolatopsis sp. TaxID=37632 RepID=UPI002DFE8909|nr:MOSC domain-containing protein [Amycolatopsis sp.]
MALGFSAVFVGRPSVLGFVRERPVYSAITKARVTVPTLGLSEINLDGDDQADRSVHGGVDKAVYVHPASNYAAWQADGFEVSAGAMGENVTVTGTDEQVVRIGDVWAWGDARVQVSQPRQPCFKLAMKTGRKDVIPAMIDSGRTGWYLRVLETGEVPASGAMTLVSRLPEAPTLAEVQLVAFANVAHLDGERRDAYFRLAEKVLAVPELAEQYRGGIESTVERWAARDAR